MDNGKEEKVAFMTPGKMSGVTDIPEVGIGMLGYAFMGKAHSNILKPKVS